MSERFNLERVSSLHLPWFPSFVMTKNHQLHAKEHSTRQLYEFFVLVSQLYSKVPYRKRFSRLKSPSTCSPPRIPIFLR